MGRFAGFCPVCRKQAFSSERAATERALLLHRRDGAAMSAYPCGSGRGWHVGHTPWRLRQQGVGTRYVP